MGVAPLPEPIFGSTWADSPMCMQDRIELKKLELKTQNACLRPYLAFTGRPKSKPIVTHYDKQLDNLSLQSDSKRSSNYLIKHAKSSAKRKSDHAESWESVQQLAAKYLSWDKAGIKWRPEVHSLS